MKIKQIWVPPSDDVIIWNQDRGMMDKQQTSGRTSGEPACFQMSPWLADANVEIHKIYQHCSVETHLHGGANPDFSKQMCMTDRQRLRMSRNQQMVKVQVHKVLIAFLSGNAEIFTPKVKEPRQICSTWFFFQILCSGSNSAFCFNSMNVEDTHFCWLEHAFLFFFFLLRAPSASPSL